VELEREKEIQSENRQACTDVKKASQLWSWRVIKLVASFLATSTEAIDIEFDER
jgi:hypothetical protein